MYPRSPFLMILARAPRVGPVCGSASAASTIMGDLMKFPRLLSFGISARRVGKLRSRRYGLIRPSPCKMRQISCFVMKASQVRPVLVGVKEHKVHRTRATRRVLLQGHQDENEQEEAVMKANQGYVLHIIQLLSSGYRYEDKAQRSFPPPSPPPDPGPLVPERHHTPQ